MKAASRVKHAKAVRLASRVAIVKRVSRVRPAKAVSRAKHVNHVKVARVAKTVSDNRGADRAEAGKAHRAPSVANVGARRAP